jgi:predicted Zn-dependent peptidase
LNYIKKDLGSFNLHLIKTDKFKTVTLKVVFNSPIKKNEITLRNVLSDMLLQSTMDYSSRRDLTIKSEELYAADISTNNQRLGNYILTSFNLQILNDKYTESGNMEEAIKFISDIIFRPDVKDECFNNEKLDIVKNNTKVVFDSLKEDSNGYALIRMSEAYDNNSPISYRMTGYSEDLEKINTSNLYLYYTNMINNDFVDIFVLGDIDADEVLTIIKKYFKFRKVKKRKVPYIVDSKKCGKKRKICKETINNSQSKLAIACPIDELTEYERNYSLVLANIILGGVSDSKLFKEVREENSLCYTIYSYPNKLDNLLVISAGIDRNNFNKTVEVITKVIDEMKKGKFSDKDINMAKAYYNTAAEEVWDSEQRIINEFLAEELLGIDRVSDRVIKMNKVKKSEIVKVCKKIGMDTIFLLEGVKHEED